MSIHTIPINQPPQVRRILQLRAPKGALAAVDAEDGVEAFLHDLAGGGSRVVDVGAGFEREDDDWKMVRCELLMAEWVRE